MRGKKCWKRVTAVLMAFMMLVGLVMTNGITSEAYWYNSEGERYPNVGYRTHVQSKGWERKLTLNGRTSGTVGAGKRLEAIQIIVEPGYGVGVEYRTHIQSKGWEKTWKKDGETSGTSGEAKRLEAIQIRLTGTNKNKYDIYWLGKEWCLCRNCRTGKETGSNPDYHYAKDRLSNGLRGL